MPELEPEDVDVDAAAEEVCLSPQSGCGSSRSKLRTHVELVAALGLDVVLMLDVVLGLDDVLWLDDVLMLVAASMLDAALVVGAAWLVAATSDVDAARTAVLVVATADEVLVRQRFLTFIGAASAEAARRAMDTSAAENFIVAGGADGNDRRSEGVCVTEEP